jgi:hypothetical protein
MPIGLRGVGSADSGVLAEDTTDLLVAAGEAAKIAIEGS